MNPFLKIAVLAALVAWTSGADSQSGGQFEIERSAVAPGEVSSGGDFSLRGVIGQAEANADPATGGQYVLRGGFLSSPQGSAGDSVFANGFE